MEPQPYKTHTPAAIEVIEVLDEEDVEARILDAVEDEGPVTVKRLYSVFAGAAGVSALPRAARSPINRAVTALRRSHEIIVTPPPMGDGVAPWVVRLASQPDVLYRELGPRLGEQVPWNELIIHISNGLATPESLEGDDIEDVESLNRAVAGPPRHTRTRAPRAKRWSPQPQAAEHYQRWNDELVAKFYSSEASGRPVYLDLEDDILNDVCVRVGDKPPGRDAFLRAVRATLAPRQAADIAFSHHVHASRAWEAAGSVGPPPFVGLLGAFVVTAEDMCGDGDFAANNYYGRLAKNLGYAFQDSEVREGVARDYRDWGAQLWGSLNGWLRDNDGRYGLPTAQAFDQRRYVTLPMSQALLREHDRQKLPAFFVESDLSAGQQVVADDIEPLLVAWLPHSRMSQGLKTLWGSTATARERVSEVVANELAVWDGAVDAHSLEDAGIRLRVAMSLETFPEESVQFVTLVNKSSSPAGSYLPSAGTSEQTTEALGRCAAGLDAVPSGLEGWLVLDDSGCGCTALVLNGVLMLECAGRVARRPVRRVVVLERDELNRVFIEADRAHLGVDSVILVHESIWESMQEPITKVLRDGWRLASADAGVPRGWVLLLDAQVIGVAGDDPDLEPLIPLSLVQVSFENGLKLPGRGGWHADAPPDIVASCLTEEDFGLEIVPDRPGASFEFGPFNGATVLSASDWHADERDYFVLVKRGGTVLAHRTLSLRVSESPPIGPAQDVGVDPTSDDQAPLLGAWRDGSLVPGAVVRGPWVPDGYPTHASPGLPSRFDQGPGLEWPASLSDDFITAQHEATQSVDPPACLLTGTHLWRVATVMPGQSGASQPAVCSICGHKKIFRPTRSASKAANVRRVQERPPVIARLRAADEVSVSVPVALDAVFYAGDGSINMLTGLASRVSERRGFAIDFVRSLSALGYVDLVLDEDTLRPRSFSVAPPCLVVPRSGSPFLSGGVYRDVLLSAQAAAQDCGARLERDDDALGLPVWRLAGLDSACVEDFADLALLSLSRDPGLRLLEALPDGSGIIDRLPRVRLGSRGLKRFDYAKNWWIAVDDSDIPGAYRLNGFGSRYAVLREGMAAGFGVECDFATAKYLAASSASSMVWYEPDDQELICRLGAPLFPLLERALFLDSGRRPRPHADGTYRYPDVRPDIAQHVQRIIEGATHGQ